MTQSKSTSSGQLFLKSSGRNRNPQLFWSSGAPLSMCQGNWIKTSLSSRATKQFMKWYWVCSKKNPQKYAKLILRMGGFHIAQHFLGAIGHLMQASGVEDIIVEADVCHRGTAKKMSGKDYYAMLHSHTVVHAAMFALHWEAFAKWLIDEEKELECMSMLTCNVQLLIDALPEKNEEKSLQLTN